MHLIQQYRLAMLVCSWHIIYIAAIFYVRMHGYVGCIYGACMVLQSLHVCVYNLLSTAILALF